MHVRSKEIAAWLRGRVSAAGAQGLVVGLSGGVDSAVVARLCQIAMPEHTLAAILPCHSDPRNAEDARLVADHFKLPTVRIDLAPAYDRFTRDMRTAYAQLPAQSTLAPPQDDARSALPLANVTSRLRMTALYFLANSLNYLVAGTANRSELEIGYFTKYGDAAADVLPLGAAFKSEVRALAKDLAVPPSIIDKPPSAGLWLGQTHEEDMGFTYADLEHYLTDGPDAVAPAVALKIERLMRSSEHQRAGPPVFEGE